jgi:prephenate dehydrogenase
MASVDGVTIIGVGLIGGSFGMALRARKAVQEVVGVSRVEKTIAAARDRGAIDRGTVDPVAGVAGADLIILATPPDLVAPMAQRVLPYLRPGAVLTDVASVKAEIVRSVEALMPSQGRVMFVGGHPMAGTEGRGVAAASATLFEGTAYLLTPTPRTDPGAVERVSSLARAVGAMPVTLTPEDHDRTVALVSHLPYLISVALMGVAQNATQAAGPAFLGATRVARSPVELWAQICRLNREPILGALRGFREELARLEAALSGGDRLDTMLEGARKARLRLTEPPAPRDSA